MIFHKLELAAASDQQACSDEGEDSHYRGSGETGEKSRGVNILG